MTEHTDEELRATLADADPAATADLDTDRLYDRVAQQALPRGYWRRHWRGTIAAAAAVAVLFVATIAVAPVILGGGYEAAESSGAANPYRATDQGLSESATSGVAPQADSATGSGKTAPADQTIVRTADLLVSTGDPAAARDTFVATVQDLGGEVVSETVTTESGGSAAPMTTDSYYSGQSRYYYYLPAPGIQLTVRVPADQYEAALQAAQAAGTVVSMEQSAYDAATQIADTDARITALESSLKTLNGLMKQATSVSDVLALEEAITDRQAELDGLKAQQRELAESTSKSQITLGLMTPENAEEAAGSDPSTWSKVVQAVLSAWLAFAVVLAAIAPLVVLVWVIVWLVRRRRKAARAAGTGRMPE